MKQWRLSKKGKPDLNCLLNGHNLCGARCDACTTLVGHCKCGLRVEWSEDDSLLGLGESYFQVEKELNGHSDEED